MKYIIFLFILLAIIFSVYLFGISSVNCDSNGPYNVEIYD